MAPPALQDGEKHFYENDGMDQDLKDLYAHFKKGTKYPTIVDTTISDDSLHQKRATPYGGHGNKGNKKVKDLYLMQRVLQIEKATYQLPQEDGSTLDIDITALTSCGVNLRRLIGPDRVLKEGDGTNNNDQAEIDLIKNILKQQYKDALKAARKYGNTDVILTQLSTGYFAGADGNKGLMEKLNAEAMAEAIQDDNTANKGKELKVHIAGGNVAGVKDKVKGMTNVKVHDDYTDEISEAIRKQNPNAKIAAQFAGAENSAGGNLLSAMAGNFHGKAGPPGEEYNNGLMADAAQKAGTATDPSKMIRFGSLDNPTAGTALQVSPTVKAEVDAQAAALKQKLPKVNSIQQLKKLKKIIKNLGYGSLPNTLGKEIQQAVSKDPLELEDVKQITGKMATLQKKTPPTDTEIQAAAAKLGLKIPPVAPQKPKQNEEQAKPEVNSNKDAPTGEGKAKAPPENFKVYIETLKKSCQGKDFKVNYNAEGNACNYQVSLAEGLVVDGNIKANEDNGLSSVNCQKDNWSKADVEAFTKHIKDLGWDSATLAGSGKGAIKPDAMLKLAVQTLQLQGVEVHVDTQKGDDFIKNANATPKPSTEEAAPPPLAANNDLKMNL